MKFFIWIPFLLITQMNVWAQAKEDAGFPTVYEGIWKGMLTSYSEKGKQGVIPMELHILPLDSTKWVWKLVYMPQDRPKDERLYELILKDASKNYFIIDEKNGILLDSYYMGGCFFSNFSIQDTEVLFVLRKEAKKLHLEMITTNHKATKTTGGNGDNVPAVDSYLVQGYSKVILKRSK